MTAERDALAVLSELVSLYHGDNFHEGHAAAAWDAARAVLAAQPAEPPATDADRVPNNDEVICPGCTHQFRAVPVNVQEDLTALRAENERQAREIAELTDVLMSYRGTYTREKERAERAESERDALRLQNDTQAALMDGLREDALRYRWLRANWTTMTSIATRSDLRLEVGTAPWADFGGDTIDAAIDAARAKVQP